MSRDAKKMLWLLRLAIFTCVLSLFLYARQDTMHWFEWVVALTVMVALVVNLPLVATFDSRFMNDDEGVPQ